MIFRPIDNNILIRVQEAESVTAGGIILPEKAKQKTLKGQVMAVGCGRTMKDGSRSEMQTRKGDMVVFTDFAGTEVTIAGQDYLIVQEDDVLAIINDNQ